MYIFNIVDGKLILSTTTLHHITRFKTYAPENDRKIHRLHSINLRQNDSHYEYKQSLQAHRVAFKMVYLSGPTTYHIRRPLMNTFIP